MPRIEEPVKAGWVLVHGYTFSASKKPEEKKLWKKVRTLRSVFHKNKSPFLSMCGVDGKVNHALSVMEHFVPRRIDARTPAKELADTTAFTILAGNLFTWTRPYPRPYVLPHTTHFFDYVQKMADYLEHAAPQVRNRILKWKGKAEEKAREIAAKATVKEHQNTQLFSMVFTNELNPSKMTNGERKKLNHTVYNHFDGRRVVFFGGGMRNACVRVAMEQMLSRNPEIVPVLVDDLTKGAPGKYEDIIDFEVKDRSHRAHMHHVKAKDINSPEKLVAKVREILGKT